MFCVTSPADLEFSQCSLCLVWKSFCNVALQKYVFSKFSLETSNFDRFADSVFMPNEDIDLEKGKMDKTEIELEKFKRFCFDTTPVQPKHKVKVKLVLNAMAKRRQPSEQ